MTDIKLTTLDKSIPYSISLPADLSPTRSLQIVRYDDMRKMDLSRDAPVVILRDDFPKSLLTEVIQDVCRRFPVFTSEATGNRRHTS